MYRDNGNENGSYYLGFMGLGFRLKGVRAYVSVQGLRVSGTGRVRDCELRSVGVWRVLRDNYPKP